MSQIHLVLLVWSWKSLFLKSVYAAQTWTSSTRRVGFFAWHMAVSSSTHFVKTTLPGLSWMVAAQYAVAVAGQSTWEVVDAATVVVTVVVAVVVTGAAVVVVAMCEASHLHPLHMPSPAQNAPVDMNKSDLPILEATQVLEDPGNLALYCNVVAWFA